MRVAIVMILLAALGARAWADDGVVTYRADGAAPATSADDKNARNAALDVAFQAATRKALEDLAAPDAIAAQKDAVDEQIVKRARLWVASFKVASEGMVGGTITVTVDEIGRAHV